MVHRITNPLKHRYAAFFRWRDENKYLLHLIGLVFLIILFPYFENNFIDQTFLKALLTLVLISGVYAVADTLTKFLVAVAFAVPSIALNWLFLTTHNHLSAYLADIFTLLFFAFATITILLSVLRQEAVGLDTVFGAICVYLLMGLTWATGYAVLETTNPRSFVFSGMAGGSLITFSDQISYSFCTLTTVGFNTIDPVTSTAKTMVSFEAVCGTLYLAVLIAWLISAFSHHRLSRK